jgi:RND family efflux transporter MFP subunit
MKFNILLCSLIVNLAFTGCGNGDAPRQEEEDDHSHGDAIVFTREQAANITFAVQEVQPATFHQVVKTSGQILPATGEEVVIVATNHGIVSFPPAKLAEGKTVDKGEALFQLSTRGVAEGDYYTRTKASYEAARQGYERAEALIGDKIISRQEYENARLEYESARLAFEAIAGRQTASGISISSPLKGYIKNIRVKAGEYVTAGQPLATVTQDRRLVLQAEVSQKYYPALKQVSTAHFQTPYDQRVHALSELNGRVLSHGKSSGENSFYIPISFEFDNREGIIPGTFVEVFLISAPIENALAIPLSALTNEMGHFYVYVQVEEDEYRKQEVFLGARDGREVQVVRGLQPGDRVVTLGAYQVKMAAGQPIPHGHAH